MVHASESQIDTPGFYVRRLRCRGRPPLKRKYILPGNSAGRTGTSRKISPVDSPCLWLMLLISTS